MLVATRSGKVDCEAGREYCQNTRPPDNKTTAAIAQRTPTGNRNGPPVRRGLFTAVPTGLRISSTAVRNCGGAESPAQARFTAAFKAGSSKLSLTLSLH